MNSNRKHARTLFLVAASGARARGPKVNAARCFATTTPGLQVARAPAVLRRKVVSQRNHEESRKPTTFTEPVSDADVATLIDNRKRTWPDLIYPLLNRAQRTLPSAVVDRNVCFIVESLITFGSSEWSPSWHAPFGSLVKMLQVKVGDVAEVSRALYGSADNPVIRNLTLGLMQCCAEHGNLHACLDLGAATLSDKPHRTGGKPRTSNAIARRAMDHLYDFAAKGNVLAATRLAEYLSNSQKLSASRDLWDRAVALAKEHKEDVFNTSIPTRFGHLQKPWILAAEHLRGKDDAKANEFLRTGMQLDDADAYAAYALQNNNDDEGNNIKFLEWLNAATKAAASGSVESSISLARHYANRAACDPVDDLQLDRPDLPRLERMSENLKLGLLRLISPSRYRQKLAAIEKRDRFRINDNELRAIARNEMTNGGDISASQIELAEFDASCRTPEDRMGMAIHWLELAVAYKSLPAALELAFLHSRRYVFQEGNMYLAIKHPDDQTDSDILEMTAQYPQIFGENPTLEEPWDYSTDEFPPMENAQSKRIVRRGTENPFYSPRLVADYLLFVARGFATFNEVEKQGLTSRVDKLLLNEEWFLFPDTSQANEKVCERCWETARRYANVLGVDLEHTAFGEVVILRHGGKRGQGISEMEW